MKQSRSMFMAACIIASMLPANVYAAENFTVTPTGITADRVGNFEGFGSITMEETNNLPDTSFGWGTAPESTTEYHGLVNRDQIVFPYTQGSAYYVYDGVISHLGGDDYDIGSWTLEYALENEPRYYDLNGNRLFEHYTLPDVLPDWLEMNEIEAGGYTLSCWDASPMVNGYAKVMLTYYPDMVGGNLVAFIDKTGKVICIADAVDSSFNTPNMSESKGLGWFGDNGWIAYSEPYYINNNDSIWSEESSRILGYLDVNGQEVLNISQMCYKDAWPFKEGISIVEDQNGLKGAIDTNGNQVIFCSYLEIGTISDGILGVRAVDNKCGYIDKTGQTVIPFMYDDVYGWADGLGAVVLDGKCGLIDANNNIVLPLEYDDITSFDNGVCYAIKDRQLYVITR